MRNGYRVLRDRTLRPRRLSNLRRKLPSKLPSKLRRAAAVSHCAHLSHVNTQAPRLASAPARPGRPHARPGRPHAARRWRHCYMGTHSMFSELVIGNSCSWASLGRWAGLATGRVVSCRVHRLCALRVARRPVIHNTKHVKRARERERAIYKREHLEVTQLRQLPGNASG